jgi:ABC-2 type transport system permease protein
MAVTVNSEAGRSLGGGTMVAVREVTEHLELLRMLVIKDLKIRYKASAIGLFWSLLNPLLMMLVYTAIFGVVFKSQRPEFPIFVLSGLLAWNFFGTVLPPATLSVVGNSNLIKKTRFPTSLLPLSVVLSGFVNFLISLVLLVGLLVLYRHPVGLPLVWLPALLVAQVFFTAGLSLLLSSLNVLFRDVEHFLGIILTVWFFATPIIYPREAVQGSRLAGAILNVNPMTWLIDAYQTIFYGKPDAVVSGGATHYVGTFTAAWPDLLPTVGFVALSVVTLVIGFTVFVRLSRRFAEEV